MTVSFPTAASDVTKHSSSEVLGAWTDTDARAVTTARVESAFPTVSTHRVVVARALAVDVDAAERRDAVDSGEARALGLRRARETHDGRVSAAHVTDRATVRIGSRTRRGRAHRRRRERRRDSLGRRSSRDGRGGGPDRAGRGFVFASSDRATRDGGQSSRIDCRGGVSIRAADDSHLLGRLGVG